MDYKLRIKRVFRGALSLLLLPIFSLGALLRAKKYRNIQSFCCFIGFSRSGHTLVGSILDAHPEVIISSEADAFKLVAQGYGKTAILFYVEFWSDFVFKFLGNKNTNYAYKIKTRSLDSSKSLKVMGDKKGSGTLRKIIADPQLPKTVEARLKMPVKYIHVVRNPFDVISTMYNRKIQRYFPDSEEYKNGKIHDHTLIRTIEAYLWKLDGIEGILTKSNIEVLNIRHEDLISNPRKSINSLLAFIGVEGSEEYLQACEELIYDKPNESRYSINWSEEHKKMIQQRIDGSSFLKGYSY